MSDTLLSQRIRITFSVEDWAKIIAAVGTSRLELSEKDAINSVIYDCVTGRAT